MASYAPKYLQNSFQELTAGVQTINYAKKCNSPGMINQEGKTINQQKIL